MMNEALKEQISAYVDGELSEAESALLVRRLSQDAELRALAASYLSIGRAVRGEAAAPGLATLRARIADGLELDESAAAEAERPTEKAWLRPLAGVGIAATVAAVTLLGLQTVGDAPEPPTELPTDDLAALAIDEAPLYTEPPLADALSDQPSEMLKRYYDQHADAGGSGILDRLVTLELRDTDLASGTAADDDGDDDASAADGNQTPD